MKRNVFLDDKFKIKIGSLLLPNIIDKQNPDVETQIENIPYFSPDRFIKQGKKRKLTKEDDCW